MEFDAIILGAGPAGLAIAHELHQGKARIKIIEASSRIGGAIRTIREEGWIVETGPNTLQLEGESDLKILQGYGLESAMQFADTKAAQRYILSESKLHSLNAHPLSLLKSDLLSLGEKLRLVAEVFKPRQKVSNESIHAFISRRFGPAAADLLIDPVIAGTYAGDPRQLMVENCFPALIQLEKEYRSIILGLLRKKRVARKIIGFKNGMQELADAMAKNFRTSCVCNHHITLIQKSPHGWRVTWRSSQGEVTTAETKKLIITIPHWQWPTLPLPPEIQTSLQGWNEATTPPVTVVARGYRQKDVAHSLAGFGYLIPRREKREVLGCLFSSSILPHRSPKGMVLLTCFIGGARQPELTKKSPQDLAQIIDRELDETLGVKSQPVKEWIQHWEQSIPQYTIGQTEREDTLAKIESANTGLHFHGSFRGGISLMQVIRGGQALAQKILKR